MLKRIKKLCFTFIVSSVFMSNGLMADILFYYSSAVLPSIISVQKQSELESLIVGKTKFFVNELDEKGYRVYATDGNYTGSVTLVDGTMFEVSGTYDIVDNNLTIKRTSPEETIFMLTYLGMNENSLEFNMSVDDGEITQMISFETEVERDTFILESLIVGTTKYYANTLGSGFEGDRTYAIDGSFTENFLNAEDKYVGYYGSYSIEGNVLTIVRFNSTASLMTLVFLGKTTHGALLFNGSVNSGPIFQTYSYETALDRETYGAGGF